MERRGVSDYERIEGTLEAMTPNPRSFKGTIYPPGDVQSDESLLDAFKETPGYKRGEERSDAKLLEKIFTDMVEQDDWFGEEEAYSDDPDYLALVTFPTSEIDDTFNHIDVIGMISNEVTGHETMPFAIDLTYNTDAEKMAQKFRWKHVYGKKRTASSDVSEFGEVITEKDYHGRDVQRTRALLLRFRHGLKIPGFASAKYYEDRNNPWEPMHEKGRIDIMPRFIVGYSTDITDVLSDGKPTEEFRKRHGEHEYKKQRALYDNAKRCAKWCTLVECSRQASDIRSMLEGLSPEQTQWMDPSQLEIAKKQIAAMEAYFAKALEAAEEKAQTDEDEMIAMRYVDRDTVCQAILDQSYTTYSEVH